MEGKIDRELAAGKVEQISAVIDGTLSLYNAGWQGDKVRVFIDDLGAALEALRTLTRAIAKEIEED